MDNPKLILIPWLALGIVVLFSGCIVVEEGYTNGTIEIKGSALASNLSSYQVEIGEGFNPSSWSTTGVELSSGGNSEVNNGTLANWDTTQVKDGKYTLKLTVIDTNNQVSQDLVYVNVDNIFISSPENGSAFSNQGTLEITGKAVSTIFDHYTLEYAPKENPTQWSSAGIALTNQGGTPVDQDLLATWDTSSTSESGEYILRLNIYSPTELINYEDITITLANYQPGWPQSTNGSVYSSPAIGDLEGDGDLEVVVGSDDYKIYAWHHDGSLVEGWPQYTYGYVRSSPALFDIDGDGDLEIAVGSNDGKVYLWHHNGSLVENWPQELEGYYAPVESSPAVGDLDGDGRVEIIAGSNNKKVYVWHDDGSTTSTEVRGDIEDYSRESAHPYLENTNQTWTITRPGFSSIAVHFSEIDVESYYDKVIIKDATGNSIKEYSGDYSAIWSPSVTGDTIQVTLESDYMINGWGFAIDQVLNGSVIGGWPQETGGYVISSPALGDLDGDGDLEVVVGSSEGKVYAWHHDGSLVEGWPQNIVDYAYLGSSPALADLDGDGDLEIMMGVYASTSQLYAWHHDGSPVSGWPLELYGSYYDSSPAVGDLDQNGEEEVVIGSGIKIYIYNKNGNLLSGWPQTSGGSIIHSPALVDLEGDGDLEVVAGSNDGKVYAWHHDGSSVSGWPKETGGNYVDSSPAVADLDGDGDLEVIIGSLDGKVHVWDEEGHCNPYEIEWGKFRYNLFNTGWYGGEVINVTSTTTTTTTTLLGEVPGDTDGDGDVNDVEILSYIGQWVEGLVDDMSLLIAIGYWAT